MRFEPNTWLVFAISYHYKMVSLVMVIIGYGDLVPLGRVSGHMCRWGFGLAHCRCGSEGHICRKKDTWGGQAMTVLAVTFFKDYKRSKK